MKCPYRTHIYIFRNSNGDDTGRAVEFENCYENECPHFDNYEGKKYCQKAEAQQEGRWKS